MIRRFVSARLGPALAVAAALALASAAQAQPPGGGRPLGGQPFGGGYSPGGQIGSQIGGQIAGPVGSQIGGQIGSQMGGQYGGFQPGYSYPGAFGGYYQQRPGTGYVYPGTAYPSQQVVMPQYGAVQPSIVTQPGTVQQTPGASGVVTSQSLYQPTGNIARITVKLPDQARLWVDDYQSKQTGPERMLNTPPLEPGKKFHYTLKAQWDENGRPVTQERTAEIQAGGETTVDFTHPARQSAEPLPSPANRPSDRPDARPLDRPDARQPDRPDARPSDRPDARPPDRPDTRPPARPSDRPPARPGTPPPG